MDQVDSPSDIDSSASERIVVESKGLESNALGMFASVAVGMALAADLLAMASYSQVAAQYVFLLIGAKSIGNDATSVWVLLLGIAWIVVLTWLCWRGIEISAKIQITLVVVEVAILLVMAIVALIKVVGGSAPLHPRGRRGAGIRGDRYAWDRAGQPGAHQRRAVDAWRGDLRQFDRRLDPQPPAGCSWC